MAAGEKSSAYLSGRAVKVCKGQIKGEAEDAAMKKSALGMAMYGKKAKMNEAEGQVNVFGYQTKHFDICPGAQSLYKKITDEKLKDDAIKSAKLQVALFAMEKRALKSGAEIREGESPYLALLEAGVNQATDLAIADFNSRQAFYDGMNQSLLTAFKGEGEMFKGKVMAQAEMIKGIAQAGGNYASTGSLLG